MPIYEFTCQSCSCRFEELVRNSADVLALMCIQCGSKKINKEMSVCGFSSSGKTITSSSKNCGGCFSHNCASCH
ncbi:zinc ribbon domain-containing protein [candidate division KSB1 bacterium]|nr:zinc ribbon domain-containing protein [candidate division KSB1 bacterium]